uniref:Transforming acidic coiled-coil-containing protein C-terminal domain-containing protein n=1 Tax=Anser cygnoides TaxID=8845 RepID=A0A8B9DGS2_ANSCY
MDKDGPGAFPGSPGLCLTDKSPVAITSGSRSESPLDGICLSASEKAAVLTLIREEIITKEIEANEWKKKYEESRQEVLEMRKIVAEYEKTIAQMIEDEQRTNMTSQKNLQQLTMEKDQALADLNSVERSLSDLFRRYENLKGVLEGFKKNEEALKKCAQDYLTRVKQEEQRYQALKVHAEEKLDKANEEIAQVRTKAKAESAALHAGLRKEQMKVESLERALQQKVTLPPGLRGLRWVTLRFRGAVWVPGRPVGAGLCAAAGPCATSTGVGWGPGAVLPRGSSGTASLPEPGD